MHVIVHGGAGSPPDEPPDRQAVLETAADRAQTTGSPVDAVVDAVRVLESDPQFNAGVGSAVQSDGQIRTDAGIMTDAGATGAACAMSGVEHAVDVARAVMTETPHVLLAGERAVDFAAEVGVETDCDLWSARSRERWADADPPDGDLSARLAWIRERFGGFDTVGAVATDGRTLAAATSTGGRWFSLAGRVGDVPQIGAGFFAAEAGAASATGAGEAIARFGLARAAVRALEQRGPQAAADHAIDAFEDTTGDDAGVIVLDADGNPGSAFNTAAMQTATRRPR